MNEELEEKQGGATMVDVSINGPDNNNNIEESGSKTMQVNNFIS